MSEQAPLLRSNDPVEHAQQLERARIIAICRQMAEIWFHEGRFSMRDAANDLVELILEQQTGTCNKPKASVE